MRCRRPCADQSAARVFADKAVGYGIPGITIDGPTPTAIAAAFAWRPSRARSGDGPALIELVSMPHVRPRASRRHVATRPRSTRPSGIPADRTRDAGYVDRELYQFWSARDPIPTYAAPAARRRASSPHPIWNGSRARPKRWSKSRRARVIDAPWPEAANAGRGRVRGRGRRACMSRCWIRTCEMRRVTAAEQLGSKRPGCTASRSRAAVRSRQGQTFLEAIMFGIRRRPCGRLRACSSTARTSTGSTATRFCCCVRCSSEFGGRILNSPLAEGAVLGVCVGAAPCRASGRSARCSSTTSSPPASISSSTTPPRFAIGGAASVPMVVRMPWGGLRHAGPYHSPEHRGLVLSNAGPEDRRAVDAARRARAHARRRWPIPIRSSITSTSRSIAIPRLRQVLDTAAVPRRRFRSAARPSAAPGTTSRSCPTARTSTSQRGSRTLAA